MILVTIPLNNVPQFSRSNTEPKWRINRRYTEEVSGGGGKHLNGSPISIFNDSSETKSWQANKQTLDMQKSQLGQLFQMKRVLADLSLRPNSQQPQAQCLIQKVHYLCKYLGKLCCLNSTSWCNIWE